MKSPLTVLMLVLGFVFAMVVGFDLGRAWTPEKYTLIVPADGKNVVVDLKCDLKGDRYVCLPDIKTMREESE